MKEKQPKKLYTSKVTLQKETALVEIYQGKNKGNVVATIAHGKKNVWVEFKRQEDKTYQSLLEAGKQEFSVNEKKYILDFDKSGSWHVEDSENRQAASGGTPTAQDGGASAAILLAGGGLLVVAVVWYLTTDGGEKSIGTAAGKIGEAIEDATGSGFWDDGSVHCNPGPLDPPVLC